ncbi:MAG: GDP-mannose 4,6-dehydratase [Pseudomonadota bacterium]
MENKRALITGVTGQDGAYLAAFLLEKGYEVFGTFRRLSTPNLWRLQALGIFDRVKLIPMELIDSASITGALVTSRPHEVYNLAAQSFVGASFEQPVGTGEVTGLAVARILECIRHADPGIRFYQASTSELFGTNPHHPQNEDTVFMPASPYAAAKLYGYWFTRTYREAYSLFCVNGILFNHESPLRGLEFVTRKISNAIAKVKLGLEEKVVLGNLEASRDWGFAGDYVESMWLMLQQDAPDDYVVSTGETHTVREYFEEACRVAELDPSGILDQDPKYMRPLDVEMLLGDSAKARRKLGWVPRVAFKELVAMMVKADIARWQRWQKGEQFPWDAFNYPSEMNIITRAMKF